MASAKGKGTNGQGDALAKVKSFYEFMLRHELDQLEIDEPALKVRLLRRKASPPQTIPVPVAMPIPGVALQPASAMAPAALTQTTSPNGDALPPGSTAIKSAMMGIFYRAASPSSPPFAKEGEEVKTGHVICMIEAMKVFNEIKAEYPCKILKALVENGKPVKSGQNLFLVQRL
jgi:acetyl-CoA carboxylase biotin carboxyl carrier protein